MVADSKFYYPHITAILGTTKLIFSTSAFKFLPNIGRYIVGCFEKKLPQDLLDKWKFPTEYKNRLQGDIFRGDGSRGGPERRELTLPEQDNYTTALRATSPRQSKI